MALTLRHRWATDEMAGRVLLCVSKSHMTHSELECLSLAETRRQRRRRAGTAFPGLVVVFGTPENRNLGPTSRVRERLRAL
jgi:hypothetical protein